ncbi:hypothetical protein F5Y05DRAFT_413324 [Hypoxylon sp. FL0543]|nr:hypothetical protein F5Y05DRAFT_413324 [Hypoxylon sp. FL0543]
MAAEQSTTQNAPDANLPANSTPSDVVTAVTPDDPAEVSLRSIGSGVDTLQWLGETAAIAPSSSDRLTNRGFGVDRGDEPVSNLPRHRRRPVPPVQQLRNMRAEYDYSATRPTTSPPEAPETRMDDVRRWAHCRRIGHDLSICVGPPAPDGAIHGSFARGVDLHVFANYDYSRDDARTLPADPATLNRDMIVQNRSAILEIPVTRDQLDYLLRMYPRDTIEEDDVQVSDEASSLDEVSRTSDES